MPRQLWRPQTVQEAINRVAKWRTLLAGRHTGTTVRGTPEDIEGAAYRDLYEKLIVLRVEQSAVTRILVDKGLLDMPTYAAAMVEEANALERMYEAAWPGWRATDMGMEAHDPTLAAATLQRMSKP